MATPAVVTCYFCNRSKGSVVLIDAEGATQAVPRVVTNFVPCDDCQYEMKQGLTLFEIVPRDITRSMPEVSDGIALSGRWKKVSVDDLIIGGLPDAAINQIAHGKVGFLEGPIFERFLSEEDRAERREP